jgi:acetate kinase
MRNLLKNDSPHAAEAIDLFVYRIGRELGSLAASLGGLDVLVFTAGIGEHAAPVRARVCENARWLGVRLDRGANLGGGPRISRDDSPVSVWVIPTNEELVIAQHAVACMRAEPARG